MSAGKLKSPASLAIVMMGFKVLLSKKIPEDMNEVALVEAEHLPKDQISEIASGHGTDVSHAIITPKPTAFIEIYHVYRHRNERLLAPDRLPTATLHADTLSEAVEKLLVIAGIDPKEATTLGLDQFDADTIMDLCERLNRITGDNFQVSPFEMQVENT